MKVNNPSPIQIFLLGRFEVVRAGRSITSPDWPRRKAAVLLQRLARERRLVKDQVIDYLWPESDLESGSNNLYRVLYSLRQTLDGKLGPGSAGEVVTYQDQVLVLDDAVWVDAAEFERLCRAVPGEAPEEQAARLRQALALYGGDFLPDERYEEWTQPHRQSLGRLHREASLALAGHSMDRQEYPAALDLLSPLLSADPADERVHRSLMRAYALAGRRHEALRQYQACVEALAAEIGASPEPETSALHAQILSGELAPPPTLVPPPATHPRVLPSDAPPPLFVGRGRELSMLHTHLEAAMAGEGRILFITGEAGQGKTSLMAQFARQVQSEYPELVAAAGSCQALIGVADPYLPFRDLLGMLNGDWQRPWLGAAFSPALVQRLQALAPRTAQAIAAYAPDLVDILVPSTGPPPMGAAPPRDLNQRQVFDQMRQLLRALAYQKPLLLLLDDLQWIDTASANLLFYLGRQLADSPILIVGAYRPSEVTRGEGGQHPLAPVVHELVRYRGDIQMDLDASLPAEERRFVDALLDSEPNRLDASFREAMVRRTRGHPLFSVELLRALQDQGVLVKDSAGMWVASDLDWEILPARVEAVIARRMEALPPDLRQLLAVASVEGETFSVEVVARVQGEQARSVLHRLSRELDHRHRLVREQGEGRLGSQAITRYQFRHNLFQQYLYHQLSMAERRSLHGDIAAILEETGAQDLDRLAVTLAHHYMAAGDSARAVLYLCRAGDDARRRVALDEAVQFYESALEHGQDDDATARADVLHKLGVSLLALGKSMEAIERFSEAEKLYARAGNRTGMGAVQRLIGRSYFEQGERAKALDHYQNVLSMLEGEPENPERSRIISAIAQMHMSANQYDEAIAWGERALSLARAADIEDVVLHALTTVGVSLANKGDAQRGLAMVAESQERAEALGLPHDAGRAYAGWGDALVTLERYAEAHAVYERMRTYAKKVQTGMFEGVALVQLGYLDWWAGHWRRAWMRRQEILEWMETFPGASFAKVWASNLLGWMYNDLGLPDQAQAILDGYTAVARSAQEPQTTVPHLGQLARCAQIPAQVAALVQDIFSLTDAATYPPYEIMPALTLACGWLAQSSGGDATALARLEKVHAQMQNRQSAASLHEVRAVAAGTRGEWEQAVTDYVDAAVNWQVLERPYDLLRTLAGQIKAQAFAPVTGTERAGSQSAGSRSAGEARAQAVTIIEQLANELDEPEVKQAFLASSLVMEIRM